MKRQIIIPVIILFSLAANQVVSAQEEITVVAPTTEVAENLDLYAVAELFKESENLEEFERALNDPEIGINNLDLDGDGYVDYIRVVEMVADYTHVIILQVPLGEDEFQDVATIEIEKSGDDDYNMQIRGNEVIYGVDYYIAPVYVRVYRWPIITWIFRPFYRPYRSVFYFGYYPRWWHPYHHVTVHVYHTRTVRYRSRANFEVRHVSNVRTYKKVNYKPRTSMRLKQNERVARPGLEPRPNHQINRPITPREDAITVKKGTDGAYKKTIKTTDKPDEIKRSRPRVQKDVTDKSSVRKTTKPDLEKTKYKSEVTRSSKPSVRKSTTDKSGIRKTTKPKVMKSTIAKPQVKKKTRPAIEKKATSRSRIKKPSGPEVEKKATSRSKPKKSIKPKVEKKSTVKKNAEKSTVKKKK